VNKEDNKLLEINNLVTKMLYAEGSVKAVNGITKSFWVKISPIYEVG
jgi:hypothetical protein